MSIETFDTTILRDGRVECLSLLTGMKVSDYLDLVKGAYQNKGGLWGQREPLKTTTGRRIRARMLEDIQRGAILPPVVIGVVTHEDLDKLSKLSSPEIIDRVSNEWREAISIIDGMQRTTALLDAAEETSTVKDAPVRVEFWLSRNADSLIYRMLVLNTGQVPWNIKRQLLVIYSPLIKEIQKHVTFGRLLSFEKAERRYNGGEFSADSLIEAYIAFGLRRVEIDTQESLADEFSRLDIAEAIASKKYDHFFYPIIQILVDLDKAFSRLDQMPEADNEQAGNYKYEIGRNIFDSRPARIGFVVACALNVLGRLGMDKSEEDSQSALEQLKEDAQNLVDRLSGMGEDDLRDFLALDVLSEKLGGQKRSAVGRRERAFFETAFKILIEEHCKVPSMNVCWWNA